MWRLRFIPTDKESSPFDIEIIDDIIEARQAAAETLFNMRFDNCRPRTIERGKVWEGQCLYHGTVKAGLLRLTREFARCEACGDQHDTLRAAEDCCADFHRTGEGRWRF